MLLKKPASDASTREKSGDFRGVNYTQAILRNRMEILLKYVRNQKLNTRNFLRINAEITTGC